MAGQIIRKKKECAECKVTFFNLKTHIAGVHEKSQQFECQICQRKYTQKSTLTSHVAGVHSNLKPFYCPICQSSFTWKNSIKLHIATVHDKSKLHTVNEMMHKL